MTRTLIIIPARYHSTRLPAKLLKLIGQKSILQHVYENSLKSEVVSKVMVATDHQLIFDHCNENNMDAIMTSDHHTSGTDRVAEAYDLLSSDFDLVINVQGDEPMISEKQINKLVSLMSSQSAQIGTLYKVAEAKEVNNPNAVKLVTDKKNKVLYFSRNAIPHDREGDKEVLQKHHIGIYAFKAKILKEVTSLVPTALEQIEKLEQLRWLENGYSVFADKVEYDGFGIDVEEDLIRAREKMGL